MTAVYVLRADDMLPLDTSNDEIGVFVDTDGFSSEKPLQVFKPSDTSKFGRKLYHAGDTPISLKFKFFDYSAKKIYDIIPYLFDAGDLSFSKVIDYAGVTKDSEYVLDGELGFKLINGTNVTLTPSRM